MEKTIQIDGRSVTFKATASCLYRYKQQFGTEFLADAASLSDFESSKKQKKVKDSDGKISFQDDYDFQKLNLTLLYNIAWVMAKTADASIPDPIAWLDTFDSFPLQDVLPAIMDLLQGTFQSNAPKN